MTTQTFSYTGAYQEFVVPTDVFFLTIDCYGASGAVGEGTSPGAAGLGGYIQSLTAVTPGETLRVYVGGAGAATVAGFNGGGTGGTGAKYGGGGGGASDVRRTPYASANRLVIAGGGGGGGGGTTNANDNGGAGGGGGYTSGVAGTNAGSLQGGTGGGAGTDSAGGAAGGGTAGATAGALDAGGAGYVGTTKYGGGGGGGGYYGGGGGGGGGAGGGGGSSTVLSGSVLTSTSSSQSGNGTVSLTYSSANTTTGEPSDIAQLQANDRYQVTVLANQGTSTTDPEFRYWYANAAPWDLVLEEDTYFPPAHTLDENATYPVATLELPFKAFKIGQEIQVDGIYVEFYERPAAVTETLVTSTFTVGFTARVEALSISGWVRTVGSVTTSGVIVSDSQTYSSTAQSPDSESWPNLRSAYLPIRLQGKCRAARVIFSDVHLCAIRRVQLIGKSMASRYP